MIEIEEMPFAEKYESVLSLKRLLEGFAPKLVHEEFGKERVDELREIWKNESLSIPENSTDKEKYEIAYKNFLQMWVSANNFMGKYQGEDGTNKFMHAAILGWKRKYSRSAFYLKVVGGLSQKTAFRILAKRLAYQLQVFSPYTVSELNDRRMVLEVTPCKIAETRGHSDFCLMACKNIIPAWLEAAFKIKMNSNQRQENNCTVTFAPF